MEKEQKYGLLFANNPDISEQEKGRVIEAIQKIGGSLTFKIHQDQDGWTARCNEVRGILVADSNPHPSGEEIESQIRDAIFAAFNVRFEKKTKPVKSPIRFQYSFAN